MSEYKSYPYTVPVNHKALQHTRIKELQVRMMKWLAWYKDEMKWKIRNLTVDKDKWQDRFTFTLRCDKRAGKLTSDELKQLNYYWKIYDESR